MKPSKLWKLLIIAGIYCLAMLAIIKWPKQIPGDKKKQGNKSDTVLVQPLGDFPAEVMTAVVKNLRLMIPQVKIYKPQPMPKEAWYAGRKRYRADSVINIFGRKAGEGHIYLCLTSDDISASKGQAEDWGVMGLGFSPGNACVASAFRLHKDNLAEELFKVAIHELGHNAGLPHCQHKGCYMCDAEGKNSTPAETHFCSTCAGFLRAKGWRL